VEREKLGTAEDQNTMFARLAGRVGSLPYITWGSEGNIATTMI